MAEEYDPYATREDVAKLETRIVDRMGQLETKLVDRMGQMEVRLIKWMAGMLLVNLLGVVGLTVTLIKVIK